MEEFLKRDLLPLNQTDILINLKGKICIRETEHINCTHFIKDLSKELNLNIYSFYETKTFYENNIIKGIEDINIKDLKSPFLIDDTFTFINEGNEINKDGIYVFRSNSCTDDNMFKFDTIVDIMGLKSGKSDILDGRLIIRNRNIILLEMFFVEKGNKLMFSY